MKILLSSGLCYTQPNKRNDANLISDFTFILSYLNLALSNQARDNTTKEKEKSRPIVKPIPGYIFTSFQTTGQSSITHGRSGILHNALSQHHLAPLNKMFAFQAYLHNVHLTEISKQLNEHNLHIYFTSVRR